MEEKKNAYMCSKCGELTVTIERVKGVTPMFLGCRASGDELRSCLGTASNMMYRLPEQIAGIEPKWEWYKPDEIFIENNLSEEMREHVSQGGLLLKKIEPKIEA